LAIISRFKKHIKPKTLLDLIIPIEVETEEKLKVIGKASEEDASEGTEIETGKDLTNYSKHKDYPRSDNDGTPFRTSSPPKILQSSSSSNSSRSEHP